MKKKKRFNKNGKLRNSNFHDISIVTEMTDLVFLKDSNQPCDFDWVIWGHTGL